MHERSNSSHSRGTTTGFVSPPPPPPPHTAMNDTYKLYETLGVEKNATAQEIKKAYFRLSKLHHPDKGGADQAFQEIAAAYQVLSDEKRRQAYDIFGLAGLSASFNAVPFGRRSRSGSTASRSGTTHTVPHKLPVSLEDLYNGKVVSMAVTRSTLVGDATPCDTCQGRGAVLQVRRLGNGTVQQAKKCHCPDCGGTGTHGLRQKQRTLVQVTVEKGMRSGDKIVVPGLGEESSPASSSSSAGNLNFIVQEKPHKVFARKGNDLLLRKTLTLNEALTGFSFTVTHLDQRRLVVQNKPGEIITPLTSAGSGGTTTPQAACVKMIPHEGMPCRGNPFVRGNLYVHFTVAFPTDGQLSPQALQVLRVLLPGPSSSVSSETGGGGGEPDQDPAATANNHNNTSHTATVVHLTPTDMRNFGKGGATAADAGSDSDESIPEGVQCQQS